jgi:hypothetical protein
MMKELNIVEMMHSKAYFRDAFREKDLKEGTWDSWITFLKALYGLPMVAKEKELYSKCTERTEIPAGGFKEVYGVVGRRGGKSRISALIAVYVSLFGGFEKQLAAGEKGWVFVMANDMKQALSVIDFIKGILKSFKNKVEEELKTEIRLKNGINISVKPASYKSGRGFSTAAVILDELAFYRNAESANPAEELIISLLPGLMDGGLLIGISTPYGKFGYLYETYKQFYGKEDSDILVWKAPTKQMNPIYNLDSIKRFFSRNKSAARAEYDAEFREDIETYLTEEAIDLVIDQDLSGRLAPSSYTYKAFVDVSGGRSDDFALAIGHHEEGRAVIDAVEVIKAPISNPELVIEGFSELLKEYRVSQVTGDLYGGEFTSSAFRKFGIAYRPSKLDKNSIYLNFQPLVTTQKVILPNLEEMKMQFLQLERKTRSGGKDVVDHPSGANYHDDIANVIAGVSNLIFKAFSTSASPETWVSRLPLVGKSALGETYDREIQNIQKKFDEMKKKPRPGDRNYIPKQGDLGFIDRRGVVATKNEIDDFRKEMGGQKTTKSEGGVLQRIKRKKRENFPEIENSKTYRRE